MRRCERDYRQTICRVCYSSSSSTSYMSLLHNAAQASNRQRQSQKRSSQSNVKTQSLYVSPSSPALSPAIFPLITHKRVLSTRYAHVKCSRNISANFILVSLNNIPATESIPKKKEKKCGCQSLGPQP